MLKDDRNVTNTLGVPEEKADEVNLVLSPEEEFTQQVEHFAQQAHALATEAGNQKIAPLDLYKHLESLWEQVAGMAKRLTVPAERKKSPVLGLTSEEAEERLELFGPNETIREKRVTFWNRLWDATKNPLVILLLALGTISYLTDDVRSAVVIVSMAVIGVTLKVIQESKADIAAAQLKAMVHTTATVLRDGINKEVPLIEVVPGDVVKLSAGDMVPADVQLLKAKDLYVNQATLTGEAMPVEKFAAEEPDETLEALKALLGGQCRNTRPKARRNGFRQRHEEVYHAHVKIHDVHGALRFFRQRLFQKQLVRGLHVRPGRGCGTDPGNATHGCGGLPLQRRVGHVQREGHRQASRRHSELRGH